MPNIIEKDKLKIDLRQGDCLELMKDIPDKSIDMILCDLPYGTTACKWDIVISFDKLWEQYNRIIKDNGCVALFGSEPFASYLRMSNIKNYRYDWIWIKERGMGFNYAHNQPMRMNENILIFYKKLPKYECKGELLEKPYTHTLPIHISPSQPISYSNLNEDGTRQYKTYTHAMKKNVLYFNKVPNKQCVHPTQKPVDLLEYLIKTYTNENDRVLDNCMGSGSTGVACVNTNRNFIGIELDEKYFNIAKERINKTMGEM